MSATMRRGGALALLVLFGLVGLGAPVLLLVRADRGGATFADTDSMGMVRLSSATVEVVAGVSEASIAAANLAPGDRVMSALTIRNAGTMPLLWTLVLEPVDDELMRWLRWDIWLSGSVETCGDAPPRTAVVVGRGLDLAGSAAPRTLLGDPSPGLDEGDRLLRVGAAEVVCIVAHLPLDAPDEVQRIDSRLWFAIVSEGHVVPSGESAGSDT